MKCNLAKHSKTGYENNECECQIIG